MTQATVSGTSLGFEAARQKFLRLYDPVGSSSQSSRVSRARVDFQLP